MAHLSNCAVQVHSANSCTCGEELREREKGNMPTLRDRFSMAALTGILASTNTNDYCPTPPAEAAMEAYRYADAMMERRKG